MKTTSEFETALSAIRDEVAASDLLPYAYARYRPLLADALDFFLRRLSPIRVRALLTGQLNLPATASTAERVVALAAHLPALHKLGQVVARDRRLNPGFRRKLQQLESLAPRTSAPDVLLLLDAEFGNCKTAGIELESEPLAEGSVAIIMPFTWRHGKGPPQRGVFKLLKPDVENQMDEDLAILGALGEFLEEKCSEYHLPDLDYQETFDTIRDLLLHEVKFEEEQAHLAEAAGIYAAMKSVLIPALFPFCSPTLTAMERLDGQKPAEDGRQKASARNGLADVVAEALVATPVFSAESEALFHADPHAGNLLVTPGHRVGILDWSLCGRLRKEHRVTMSEFVLGAVTPDLERMQRAAERLTTRSPDHAAMRNVLRAGLRELRCGVVPGSRWLTTLLDNLVVSAGLRPEPDLLLFRKSLLTLDGVLAALSGANAGSHHIIDGAVISAFRESWLLDWPARFHVPLASTCFRTHLSSADLLGLWCSAPATFARWWSESFADLVPRF